MPNQLLNQLVHNYLSYGVNRRRTFAQRIWPVGTHPLGPKQVASGRASVTTPGRESVTQERLVNTLSLTVKVASRLTS